MDKLNKKIIGIYDETQVNKITTMVRGNKRIKLNIQVLVELKN